MDIILIWCSCFALAGGAAWHCYRQDPSARKGRFRRWAAYFVLLALLALGAGAGIFAWSNAQVQKDARLMHQLAAVATGCFTSAGPFLMSALIFFLVGLVL